MSNDKTKSECFRIKISQDQLSASLIIETHADSTHLTEERIDAACADRGLIAPQNRTKTIREGIEHFFAEETHESPHEVVIAKGRSPQHGEDGYLLFEPGLDPFQEEPQQESQDDTDDGAEEAIDFYNQSAFTIVMKGQVIGKMIEPTEGVDGFDVTGKVLAARNGRALDLKVDSTILLDREHRLVSQANGIIDYHGGRIRILEELDISENVDFSTGNIDFPGDVSVGKGIKDRFRVKVGKSLVVRELVEAATLICAVDCTLQRGMAGRGKGNITTGRDLCATFVDNSTLLVGRDLIVAKEIGACRSNVSRYVSSPTAALVGGELIVAQRCELAQIGSESGVKTLIALGRHHEVDALARKLGDLLPDALIVANRLRKRRETMATQGTNLSAEQTEELTNAQRAASDAEGRVSRIRSGLERLWTTHRENTNAELVVTKVLYSGVQVAIGGFMATIKENLKGPVRIWLAKGEPQVGDLDGACSPLSSVASVEECDRFPDLQSLAEPPNNMANAA